MDYGKWKYSQKKKHKKHHEQQLKQVRIRPKTDDFDREIKVNRAIRFLKKGDKVQFTMVFRGRERAHRDLGVSILSAIARKLGELVKLERPPSMDGRNMIMIVSPIKAALDKYKAPEHLDEGGDEDDEHDDDDGEEAKPGSQRRGGLTTHPAPAAASAPAAAASQSAPAGASGPPAAPATASAPQSSDSPRTSGAVQSGAESGDDGARPEKA